MKQYLEEHPVLVLCGSLCLFLALSWIWYRDVRAGDDTYIYLQFARHLVHGDGLCFNAGEPTYGFTSILWLLVLSALGGIGGDYVAGSVIAGLLASSLVVVTGSYFAYRSTRNRAFAGFVALLFALDPNLLKHSFLGMETPLSGLLVFAAVFLRREEHTLRKKWPWSALVCAMAVLNRPESGVIAALLLIDQVWNRYRPGAIVRWVGLFFLPIIVWAAIAFFTFGSPIPNTIVAKGDIAPSFGIFLRNAKDSAGILLSTYAVVLAVLLWQLRNIGRLPRPERTAWIRSNWLPYSIPLVMVLAYSVFVTNELVYARYLFIFIPLILYEAARTLVHTPAAIPAKWTGPLVTGIFVQFVSISVFMSISIYKTYVPSEAAKEEMFAWVRNNVPPDASIAADAIGRIGFETGRKIICTKGILNPEIVDYERRGRRLDFFRKTRPDYFLTIAMSGSSDVQSVIGGNGTVIHAVPVPGAYLTRQLFTEPRSTQQFSLQLMRMNW